MRELITDLIGNPIGVRNGQLQLVIQPSSIVDKLVVQHHYSHKSTPNRMLSMIVLHDDHGTIPLGFIQLGYGIRPHMKHTISTDITKDNYCEFDRMWLDDILPHNSETTIIGMLLWFIKRYNSKITYIITYADGSVGNVGTIYKASNAIYIGKIPVDFYLLATGERVHPVTMWHRHGSRAWALMQEKYPGIKHIKGTEFQYRYLYILNKKKRNQWLAQH